MLTQDQKLKLEPLTRHEKFGKLLIAAMETWENANPIQFMFCSERGNCCLVGASVLTQYVSSVESAIILASDKYNITMYDAFTVSDGFDNMPFYENEGYSFGKAVADIVFKAEHQ